jgi:hypothetical protein
MVVITIADFVFTYRATTEIFWSGDISDILYTASGLLFVWSIIALSNNTLKKRDFKTQLENTPRNSIV